MPRTDILCVHCGGGLWTEDRIIRAEETELSCGTPGCRTTYEVKEKEQQEGEQ